MLDEKKIRLMTRLSIFEKHEKHRSLVYSKYFQSDYVRYNVLKTVVSATVVYWAIIAYYVFENFEDVLAKFSEVDYFELMYSLLGKYVLFCFIYAVIATLVYNFRYSRAKDGLIQYNSDLRDLIELEGGPKHHVKPRVVKRGKVVEDSTVDMKPGSDSKTAGSDRGMAARTAAQTAAGEQRGHISRAEMVKQMQLEQDKAKQDEIRQNAARLAEQARQKELRERQAAADRQRIQERRKQLEREQLERLRREQAQNMSRENHTYSRSNQNPMARNNEGNINRPVRPNRPTNGNNEGRNS